jgi:predicted anti-sigma-YlaC factor YlaD
MFLPMIVRVDMIILVTGVVQSVDSRVVAEWLDEYSACRARFATGETGY